MPAHLAHKSKMVKEATIHKKNDIENQKKKNEKWKEGEKSGTDEMKMIIMNLIEWWKTHNIHTN